MKKILSLMLAALMLFASVSLTAVAENVLAPVSIYAGARTITVEYGENVNADNVGDIVLTTKEGVAVEYTTKFNDEFLTIIAAEEFVRDTQEYILEIGGTTKLFTVKTLFKPNFVADTTNNTVKDLSITACDGSTVDVVDENTIILSTVQGNFTLDYDEITNYENASIVADVSYLDGAANGVRGIFGYNVTSKNPTYAYVYNSAKKVNRAFWILDKTANLYYTRRVAVTDGNELKGFPGYNSPIAPLVDMSGASIKRGSYTNSYGTTLVSGQAKVGTNGLPSDYTGNIYHYVIDKMGAVGTLMFEDTFVDIMDSQDYYDEYSLTAPTKGYFVINPISSGAGRYRIMLSNLAIITSEMRDYASGNLTVASATAEGNKVTITFNEEIDFSAIDVEDYISFSDSLSYTVISKEGNSIVVEVNKPAYDKTYVLTVGVGLGYDDLTVKENENFDIAFEAPVDNTLTPSEWYVGLNTATLKFDANVTAENAPAVEITTKDGTPISATATYKSNIMTLTFASKLALDTEYVIDIKGETEIFEVKKIWEPTFTGNETDGYDVSGVIIRPGTNKSIYYGVTGNKEIVVGYSAGKGGMSGGGAGAGFSALLETGNQFMQMADEAIDWKQSTKVIEMNQKAKLADMGAKPDVVKQAGSDIFYDLETREKYLKDR